MITFECSITVKPCISGRPVCSVSQEHMKLPPIVSSLENTPPSLSEVYNASVGKLELQHGVLPDKLGWANVANSHALVSFSWKKII